MIRVIIFAIVSAFFVFISRKSLLSARSHGFFRFFAWESILALVLLNVLQWFANLFSPLQLISWVCLFISLFLALHGIHCCGPSANPIKKGRMISCMHLRGLLPWSL